MKNLILFVSALASLGLDAITIDNVTARQRMPWSSLVDVEFEINGGSASAKYVISLTATGGGGTKQYVAKSFLSEPVVTAGASRLTWDIAADYPNVKESDFEISVTAKDIEDDDGVYCVIDLAGGADAARYPVRYTTTAPSHVIGATNEPSQLTELWLKRVSPRGRQFVNGYAADPSEDNNAFYTKLTKDYYLGIFEVTQQQWFQLTGNWPSRFSNELYRAARPVDRYYPYLFFGSSNYKWPDVQVPASGSLWDKLCQKTGLSISLPTEAQWVFAAYAGAEAKSMKQAYLNADGKEFDINEIARYSRNGGNTDDDMCDTKNGTATVGSYQPNAWGFYDLIGNVSEDCLDPFVKIDNYKDYYTGKGIEFPIVDPIGIPQADATALYGKLNILRRGGGGYVNAQGYNTIHYRDSGYLAYPGDGNKGRGLRLCITCE